MSLVLIDTDNENHHKQCVERCKKTEGKMLKCLNASNHAKVPCSKLIHVACSEYSEELAACLKVYYCADCTNLKDELHAALEKAEDEAKELLKKATETRGNDKVKLADYQKMEAVATQLGEQLAQKVDIIETQAIDLDNLQAKFDELKKELAISQANAHHESEKHGVGDDSFESFPSSEAEHSRRPDTVLNRLNETLRKAAKIKPPIRVTFADNKLDQSTSSTSSRVTIGYPNYEEHEAKATALNDQSLLLIRASIVIQPFKGDITRWSMFVSDFIRTSAKGHYRAYEDMERLRDLIQGEANEMFLTELSDPFAEPIAILKRLEEFYGVRGSAVRVALDSIIQLSRIEKSNDKQRLKNLYTRAKHFALQCEIHSQTSELTSEAVLYILESKMFNEHKDAWRDWAKFNHKSDGAEGIIGFLEEKIRELNLVQIRMPQYNATAAVNLADISEASSSNPVASNAQVTSDDESTTSSKSSSSLKKRRGDVTCYLCQKKHPLYKCPKFCSLDHDKRMEEVNRLLICKRCLCSDQHQPDECSLKLLKCKVDDCSIKDTHPLLHGHSAEQIPSFIYTNVLSSSDDANFLVVPGHVISSDGNKILITIMIDTGCGSSFATTELFKGGKFSCIREYELEMKFATVASHLESQAKLFSFDFLPLGGNKLIKLENITAVSSLDLPAQCQDAEMLRGRYSHLRDIPFSSYALQKPQVLLGMSHIGVFMPVATIIGSEPEDPVALYTRLGWVVSGNLKQPLACTHSEESRGQSSSGC